MRPRDNGANMKKKVVLLGGGVAGLSAAQELAERGFDVDVYDRLSKFGGKARSIDVPDSATGNRKPLPGEHGFRFFPSFYRNTFDTLKRIPYGDNPQGVYDNLVATHEMLAGVGHDAGVVLPMNFPQEVGDWEALYQLFVRNDANIPPEELWFFASRIWTFLTSCKERRDQEFDYVTWWDFIEADRMSEEYKSFLAVGLTRDLVAMKAEVSSTRTVAKIYFQLLQGMLKPFENVNRILDAPTTEAWIDPWVNYLEQLGVTFHNNANVEAINFDGQKITGVDIDLDGKDWTATGDHYLFALPVEAMVKLVDDDIKEAAPSLRNIDKLQTGWMNGIQYFFEEDLQINRGHMLFVDSPWALTAIFEHQFWDDVDMSKYGAGNVRGFLSFCISDWNTPGEVFGKPARECTAEEIEEEVWTQMLKRMDKADRRKIEEATVVDWFLSPTIVIEDGEPTRNTEPLLLNTVGSLTDRPRASLNIDNMFLASDYVRTHADLATMESANEAGRRAVNGILSAAPGRYRKCAVYPLREPAFLEPFKAYDRIRFERGLPHQNLDEILK